MKDHWPLLNVLFIILISRETLWKESLQKRVGRLTRLSILAAVVPLTATICQTWPFAAAIAVCRPANAPVVRLIWGAIRLIVLGCVLYRLQSDMPGVCTSGEPHFLAVRNAATIRSSVTDRWRVIKTCFRLNRDIITGLTKMLTYDVKIWQIVHVLKTRTFKSESGKDQNWKETKCFLLVLFDAVISSLPSLSPEQ